MTTPAPKRGRGDEKKRGILLQFQFGAKGDEPTTLSVSGLGCLLVFLALATIILGIVAYTR